MSSFKLLVAIFAGSVAASPAGNIFDRAACNADNCLRALRNTARPGLLDCNSYLKATYTPATSTIYSTETFTTTPTLTYEVTGTITHLVTATGYVEQTATEVVTREVTVLPFFQAPAKRQATSSPSGIPKYASACSGAARYSSACSCIGGVATTVTVDAPTTVIVVAETVTPTMASEYVTIKTEEITLTASTETITTTVAIKTLTEEVPVATASDFALRINNGFYKDQYVRFPPTQSLVTIGPEKAGIYSRFKLSPNGRLIMATGEDLAYSYDPDMTDGGLYYLFRNAPASWRRLTCHLLPSKRLVCDNSAEPNAGFVACPAWQSHELTWFNGLGDELDSCDLLELIAEA